MLGHSHAGGDGQGYVIAGAVATFGTLGLVAAIWLFFDEQVAKPIDHISAELRRRARAGFGREIDSDTARFLGDLAPAAAAVCEKLGADNLAAADRIAAETARLSAERGELAAALSEIPVGVLLVSEHHQITLYDGQAAAALEDQAPLGLGHTVFDYLDPEPLIAALNTLKPDSRSMTTVSLASADGTKVFDASVRRLREHAGYMLTLDTESTVPVERPLVFDFSLLEGQHGSADQDVTPLNQLTYVVFDLETTGLHPQEDDVVQMGAVRMIKGRLIAGEVFDTLVNPGRPIPLTSTKIHGITDDMVVDAPDITKAADRFHRFTRDAVLVAHNAPFDMNFIKRQAAASGRDVTNPVLDTLLLAAELFGTSDSLTLDAIGELMGVAIPEIARHTAFGDALATAAILEKMIPILMAKGIVTLEDAFHAMEAHARIYHRAAR